MTTELFLTELLLLIITSTAFVVFWQLYRTKDGTLRKIMMAYFLTEIFMYGTFAIYWWFRLTGRINFHFTFIIPIWLLPKVIVKAVFLQWMRKNRSLS